MSFITLKEAAELTGYSTVWLTLAPFPKYKIVGKFILNGKGRVLCPPKYLKNGRKPLMCKEVELMKWFNSK